MWEIEQYSTLINKIMSKGQKRETRNGDTYSIFGETITIDMQNEFPLLRGRKMFHKPVLGELAAMVRGPKSISDFKKFGCNYWDAWGSNDHTHEGPLLTQRNDGTFYDKNAPGNINVDYGNSWLDFNGVNQLEEVVKKLKHTPNDRRILISGWRPDKLADLDLPCCHMLYQWYVRDNKFLDMLWYQRSVDTMVGLPSDIILCAAWNAALATQCGYTPGTIKLILGDTHIYSNHLEPALDYMRNLNKIDTKAIEPITYSTNPTTMIQAFLPTDIEIFNYKPQSKIDFKLNV